MLSGVRSERPLERVSQVSDAQERPNVENIIDGLKDFQQDAVEYVFKRLYKDEDAVNKFLIADEVGLGKTLVARGVLAKAVDLLWDNKEEWIDIVYVCSNREIASQNVKRLDLIGDKDVEPVTRMTYLPLHLESMREEGRKINLLPFTPGTSFDYARRTGTAHERVLIYLMLRRGWHFGDKEGPKKLLRCTVRTKEGWQRRIDEFEGEISGELEQAFLDNLKKEPDIRKEFRRLSKDFARYRRHIPWKARDDRNHLVSELRRVLAETCVQALKPKIIILDEFQRFRHLLEGEDEDANLARALFRYPGAKVILLSATPYKMYTVNEEESGEDHYQDLMRTTTFLLGKDGASQLKKEFSQYRSELFRASEMESVKTRVLDVRNSIEKRLLKVMIRTERLSVTPDRNGMLSETDGSMLRLEVTDLVSFAAVDNIARAVGAHDSVEYWKSAPFMLNTMDNGYKIKRLFGDCLDDGEMTEDLTAMFDGRECCLMDWESVQRYRSLDLENARLRKLIADTVDTGAWQLLWIPPSLRYYRADSGPYSQPELSSFTKALIFSSWKVVPKAIAMLCSYEAERRMVTAFDPKAVYREERKKRGPLLRFARKRSMSTLLLMYPCMTLAREIDPLRLSIRLVRQGEIPSEKTILKAARTTVQKLLEPILKSHPVKEDKRDERWYWAALALLDREYCQHQVGPWLDVEDDGLSWWNAVTRKGGLEEDSAFSEHIGEFYDCFLKDVDLGRPPKDLATVLARVALASPAVVTLRSLRRHCTGSVDEVVDNNLLASSAQVAAAFRSLFNIPESITMIRSLRSTKEDRYWDSVLGYCIDGNLQSVMDEYVHILKESLGLIDVPSEVMIKSIAKEIRNALSIRTAALDIDVIKPDLHKKNIDISKETMRCRFALSFGDSKNEDDGSEFRTDRVRSAFNSPFRPFVLATTSIGQEGLDFHQYCHSVIHWNLPSNPVDLEQREGRVHRYKGHAIRRNIAMKYPLVTLRGKVKDGEDPWERLFKMAVRDRKKSDNDLVPFWVFDIEGGEKIRRIVPSLPLSREIEDLEALRRSLMLYRMVFGQVRQEDLVSYLESHVENNVDLEDIMKYRIDLSPPV